VSDGLVYHDSHWPPSIVTHEMLNEIAPREHQAAVEISLDADICLQGYGERRGHIWVVGACCRVSSSATIEAAVDVFPSRGCTF
jgi:hypothetical protein